MCDNPTFQIQVKKLTESSVFITRNNTTRRLTTVFNTGCSKINQSRKKRKKTKNLEKEKAYFAVFSSANIKRYHLGFWKFYSYYIFGRKQKLQQLSKE